MYFANGSELRIPESPVRLGGLVTNLCQPALVFMEQVQLLAFLSHCRDRSHLFLLQEISFYLFQLEEERRVAIRSRRPLKEMKNSDSFE